MPSRWIAAPLVLLLPLVWRAGRALVQLATRDVRLSRVTTPGVALAVWLLAIHASGLLTHSFYVGLFAGTAGVAALGLWSLRRPLPAEPSGEGATTWMWLGALVAACALIGPVTWWKHDECLIVGHISIPTEMENGIYPPRHLTFPTYELRYHYGIDLAVAAVSSLLGRLPIPLTVHALAVVLFGYSFALYWLLGERLIGSRAAGPITAACAMFAGGGPVFFGRAGDSTAFWDSVRIRGGTWITPPMISNFLQHPWSLGLPLFAIVLLVWIRLGSDLPSRWGWLLLGVLVAALSLAQTTLFVCIAPCIVALGTLDGRRPSAGRFARYAAWAVAIVVAARLLHGFLAPTPEPAEGKIAFHPFWGETTPREFLLWHLESFGALLPLGVAGFFLLRQQRLLLGLLAAGGLLVRDLFKYWPGWNIVKFSVVSELALAILAAAVLTAAISRRRWWPLGAAGIAACTFVSLAFSVSLTVDGPGRSCLAKVASPADGDAILFLRQRIAAGEGVFRSENADAYAELGGLPQQSWDWGVKSFGFSEPLYARRQHLIDHPDDLDDFEKQGFRWLVLGPRDTLTLDAARRWTRDGRAQLSAEFPPLAVYRLQ